MKLRSITLSGAIAALVVAATLSAPAPVRAQAAPAEAEDVQVLTRGPVHEAFAEAVTFTPEPGVIVKTAPPAAIEELPPEQKPDGDNVTWIGGYWSWDDDQNDFLWISGIWRNLPPGRQWVPGYWNDLGDGQFQWTAGYWADSAATETTYIPTPPPRNLDAGANTDAPAEDSTWIPGNYVYVETRYVWRPGYWTPLRRNWTWVPSRYLWTPRGYVYVDGYWDYAVASRGVLFAPVYYHRHIYGDPGYYYTPSIAIALDLFTDHLFVRPRCGHYYFGDYYAARYGGLGYYSAYSWHSGHHGYDPIFAYERWDHRHDHGWELRRRTDFVYFRDHADARPPHTWALMKDMRGDQLKNGHNLMLATTFSGLTKNPAKGQKFVTIDKDHRDKFVTQNKEIVKFGQDRRKSEALDLAAGDHKDNNKKGPFNDKLGHSPIVGLQTDKFGKNEGPPKRPELRNPNLGKLNAATNDRVMSDGTHKNGSLSLAGGGLKPNSDNKGGTNTLDLKGKGKDIIKNPLDSGKGIDPGNKSGTGTKGDLKLNPKGDPKLSLKDQNPKNHDLQINPKGGDQPKNKDLKLDTRPKIQVDPNLKINPQGGDQPKRRIETDSLPKTKNLSINPNGNPSINPTIKPKAQVEPKRDLRINPQGSDQPKRRMDTDVQPKAKNLALDHPIIQPKNPVTPKFDVQPKNQVRELPKSLPQPQSQPSSSGRGSSGGDDNGDKRKKHNN